MSKKPTQFRKPKRTLKVKTSPKKNDPSGLADRINARFPGFDEEWNRLVHDIGSGVVDFLKQTIKGEIYFLKQLTDFKLKIVIDNNFILGQIMGTIKRNEDIEITFLYKMLVSKSVEICAPPLLEKELREKIKNVIDSNEQELALKYALVLLPKIALKDAQWTDNWKKANRLIGDKDIDDVPYLALAFEMESHGIISMDDVFHRQGEVKVWDHKGVDTIITNYHSGFISMTLIGGASALLAKIIAVVFRFIRDAIITIIDLLLKLGNGIALGISKIPAAVWFILLGLGIIFIDEIKSMGKDFITFIREKGQEILARLKSTIDEIKVIITKLLDIAKLGGVIVFEFLGFLLTEYNFLNEQLNIVNLNNTSSNPITTPQS